MMAPPRVGKTKSQKVGLLVGPVLFFIVLLIDIDPTNPVITRMAAVAVLMATWWITEAIPLGATALLPMILYPLLGILKGKATAPIYFNSTIFLFMGGFICTSESPF
jgi:sodium-dependent dicarboxylate transporter 2/3/5